jgi:hypothetical protein
MSNHQHQHRDFRCPDCGELITCLSCIEIHAGSVPQGPAFINPFAFSSFSKSVAPSQVETIGVDDKFGLDGSQPNSIISTQPPMPSHLQQSLFG